MTTLQSITLPAQPAGQSILHLQFLRLPGVFLILLLCGCASESPWKKQLFALTTPSDEIGAFAHTNFLSLPRVTVSPLFEGNALVYRTGENIYEWDPYAEFLAPPDQMLEECLRLYLRAGHAFADVLDSSSSLKSSCSLEVSVSKLYGDFRQPGKPFAVLEIRLTLYGTDNRHHMLWQRDFSKSVPLLQRTPAALLAGWNTGLQQIMAETNLQLKRLEIPGVVSAKPRDQE
jgi:uncharacterized lipoprotein YmbA